MSLASLSSSPCFRCRAYTFSFSPSPLRLYFPRGDKKPRVRSLRAESDGARTGNTQSYGSELLREEEESSEEFVDWEDKILEVTVPLVGFVRMILHSGKYVVYYSLITILLALLIDGFLSFVRLWNTDVLLLLLKLMFHKYSFGCCLFLAFLIVDMQIEID